MLLSLSGEVFHVLVEDGKETIEVHLQKEEDVDNIFSMKKKNTLDWDEYSIAALMQVLEKLTAYGDVSNYPGKKYTREGMIKRVMDERRVRAMDADYKIKFADNIYGEHTLINERGITYKITL